MKTRIILIILFCKSFSSLAQIQSGTAFLGGLITGYNDKYSNNINTNKYDQKNNSWTVVLSYGHYLTENVAIGIGLGYNSSKYVNNSTYASSGGQLYENTQQSTLYYVNPFIRVSKTIADKLYCFGMLSVKGGMGPLKYKVTGSFPDYESTYKSTQINYGGGLTGGLNYFLNNHFALMLTYGDISYSYTKSEQDSGSGAASDQNNNTIDDGIYVHLGLTSISLGLQYFIHCKTEKK